MKKVVLGVLLILLIGFVSCDGRKNKNQALIESIEEFKKSAHLEVNVYVPKTYMEQEIDTTMHNGYRVKIKTFSDMSNSVLFTKIKDTINYQTYFRNFKFNISVEKNGKLIYKEQFDKKRVNKAFDFSTNLSSKSKLYDFDKLAILKSIQVNENPSYKNKVLIDILYAIPETDKVASYTLVIDEDGKSNSIQVEVK